MKADPKDNKIVFLNRLNKYLFDKNSISMSLFPYIYLIIKAPLSSVGIKIFKAAKSLGDSNLSAVRKVILPSLKPAIIGGMALVIFEIISDFGGGSTLRIDTFTVGIYDAWVG